MMDDTQRSQIRDNANYLRQVRPIDPAEIQEYVEGQPHPAAVRRVLREEAPDLGLLGREDGTFEPVPEDPPSPTFDGVDSLPESIGRRLEDLLVGQFGPGWPDGESGDELRRTIRAFKQRYLDEQSVTYDDVTALGYALYHLPAYFATTQYLLADLTSEALLPRHLRILDVGAGVGGPALGIDALLPDDVLVEYHAVEPSNAADILAEMLEETSRNFHHTIHRERIQAFDPDGPYDIILCANVLSELDDPAGAISDLLPALAADGAVVAISPADRNTATDLRNTERALEYFEDVTVYAPTVRLWPGETPDSDCWSFTRKDSINVPGFQRRLDRGERGEADGSDRTPGDGEFVNTDVQYAYSILRTDGTQAVEFTPDEDRVAKMASMDDHVTERIDCVALKLSHDLSDGGNPLFLVGDGSEQVDHFAVLTDASALNRDLETADYGDLLDFENVLVLWNDDEAAYNLVLDGETIVDRIPV